MAAKRARLTSALLLACAVAVPSARAEEIDQFSDRLFQIARLGDAIREGVNPLDARMNALLDGIAARVNSGVPRMKAVRLAFQHPVSPELVTPYSEWIIGESGIPLFRSRGRGIYGYDVDYNDMRLAWYVWLSPLIRVAGVIQGTDKIGHFLAQGWEYYVKYLELRDQGMLDPEVFTEIRRLGHTMEMGTLGIATGGVYSYADLAANWQGFRFYRELFNGTADAYFHVSPGGRVTRARQFTWSDYVTDDWDEVINPDRVDTERFHAKLRTGFRRASRSGGPSICERYLRDPEHFLNRTGRALARDEYVTPDIDHDALPFFVDVTRICEAR